MRFRSFVVFLLAVAVVAGAVYLRRPGNGQEKAVVLAPTTENSPSTPPSPVSPPTRAELQPALDRVFERTVTVDRGVPRGFLAGDFNGDGIADLVVAVRPGSGDAAPRLNAQLDRWGVHDLSAPDILRRAAVRVAPGDRLLAVIHGAGPRAWRDPDARDGHLLKHAADPGLRARPLSSVPDAIRMRVSRTHAGDVLVTEGGGRAGVIFWTGAGYTWSGLEADR